MAIFVFALLVYLSVGWIIANSLVKRGDIEDTVSYLFSIILWLPTGIVMILWHVLKWVFVLPKRFAENQIKKNMPR